jgi:hypothetical protein
VTPLPLRSIPRRLGLPGLVLATLSLAWLGVASGLPDGAGLLLVIGALAAGVGLRWAPRGPFRDGSWVPLAVGLGVLSVVSPLTVLAELVAGLGGIAVLLCLVDDPDRLPGGVGRGATTIALPALAVGVAWASAFLLPPGAASVGVAAAILAIALASVAFLLGRPDLFDRDEAATS